MNIVKPPALTLPKFGQKSAPLSATLVQKSDGSCQLKIKGTAEFVNIRDKADSSIGKVVDYLKKGDVAAVLGTDGSSTGNEWWLIEVVHDGNPIQGWVTGKWVEFVNSVNCSQIKPVATPFP
jgi:hypothetical protein